MRLVSPARFLPVAWLAAAGALLPVRAPGEFIEERWGLASFSDRDAAAASLRSAVM